MTNQDMLVQISDTYIAHSTQRNPCDEATEHQGGE